MTFYIDPFSKLAGMGLLDTARMLTLLEDGAPELYASVLRHLALDYAESEPMIRVVKTCVQHQVGLDDMQAIGWPKLRIITRGMTGANRDSRLTLARTLPLDLLAKALGHPLRPPCKRTLKLRFDEAEWTKVSKALVQYGAERSGTALTGIEQAVLTALQTPYDLLH